MLRFNNHAFLILALAVFFNGCGVRSGMRGGPRAETSEMGSVSEVAAQTPTNQGDTTSFSSSAADKVDEYTIRPGDSLWKIAAKNRVYGSGWLYPLLVKFNKSKIKDPKNLKIGATLIIPRDLSKAEYEMAREETMAGTYDNAAGYHSLAALSLTAKLSPDVKKVLPPPAKKKGKLFGVAIGVAVGMALVWFVIRTRRRETKKQDSEPEDK